MNKNIVMASTLLITLTVVVLTPFFFSPEAPVIFYENPSLVIDYLNISGEFRIYVCSVSNNIRFMNISINITSLSTNESHNYTFNDICLAYVNTTWKHFILNITVYSSADVVYDRELIVSIELRDNVEVIILKYTKESSKHEIMLNDLPYAITIERRW